MRHLVLILALAACAPPEPQGAAPAPPPEPAASPAAAETGAIDFRAVGQEPGWVLNIYRENRITLEWDYGESRAEFPLTEPSYPQEGSTRYISQADGRLLGVTIQRFPCQDVMSGEDYPARVMVTIDGRTLEGCGRSL